MATKATPEEPELSGTLLVHLSLLVEKETGYDSIPTACRMAARTRQKYLRCYFPGCKCTFPSASALWKHLHFTRKHGYSFKECRTPEQLAALYRQRGFLIR